MKPAQTETLAGSRNPGETLRNAREARGVTTAEAARQLNLTETSVHHIEAGAFDRLPGHTFARGYVRAYAKLLGLDQADIVREFDQFTGTNASGAAVHSLGRIEEPSRLSQNLLRLVSFGLLLLLCLAGFFWWQEQGNGVARDASGRIGMEHVEVDGADGKTEIHTLDEPEDQAVIDAQAPEGEPTVAAPSVDSGENDEGGSELPLQPQGASTETLPQAPQSSSGTSAEQPTEQTPATPAQSAPAAPQQPNASAAAPAAGQGMVRISFTADCWTQVTDADGKTLSSRLQRQGDVLELTGRAPLRVRLGYARGAEVTYNGQAVDVMSRARGQTATLTLGQ
ncbi:RodZ domain-containing protein [Pseudomonas sp. Marseille-QA0892]